jgi:hypothetical protein
MVRPATKLKRVKRRLKHQGVTTQNAKIQAQAELKVNALGLLDKAGSMDCICPLCYEIASLSNTSIFKLNSSNQGIRSVWVCEQCDAWAVCRKTSSHMLGTIANRETWTKRRRAIGTFYTLCCVREAVFNIQIAEKRGGKMHMDHVVSFLAVGKSSLRTHRKTLLWLCRRLNKLEYRTVKDKNLILLKTSSGGSHPLNLKVVYPPMYWFDAADSDKAYEICKRVIDRLSIFLNNRLSTYI